MYKTQNGLAPNYLTEAYPPLAGEISLYNLRNADNIALSAGKKQGSTHSSPAQSDYGTTWTGAQKIV